MNQVVLNVGEHHLTRENFAHTIAWLKRIEAGEENADDVDWRTSCGVLALQIECLLRRQDN